MKFLSWNIQQGGGSRVLGILKFIAEQNPDVLVLSEFRNNKSGILIRQKLLEKSYFSQAVSLPISDTNSVLIASKFPSDTRLFVNGGLDFAHDVIAADYDAFHLYGVYLPHKKKHKLFNLLQEEVVKFNPAIIMGDFNTGKNFIDQKKDSFWYTEDLKKLESLGMQDAFRHIHGQVEAYSWFSHQGNGYRYDHIYVHEDLLPLVKSCDYIHKAREEKLSDHSPMILELG